MLKKIITASSIACMLMIGAGVSANAATLGANEEDIAAPAGSFTSEAAVPHDRRFQGRHQSMRFERFALQQGNAPSFGGHRAHEGWVMRR